MNYEQFKQIVLRMIQEERVEKVSIYEVQTEMRTLDGQHDNAVHFQTDFPHYARFLKPRASHEKARPFRSYRAEAFRWLRNNSDAFLTLEKVVLGMEGHINFKRAMRLAGIEVYNDHITPTLRRLLLRRNPSLKGRLKIRAFTLSGTLVVA